MKQLEETNALKGGSMQTQGLMDSEKNNFDYGVFRRQMFHGDYEGISRLVKDKLNDPDYYNQKLRGIKE